MSLAAIRNAVNYNNSQHRQVDEVTLCDPKGSEVEMGIRNPRKGTRWPDFADSCNVKRVQCFLVGAILFLLLITVGHVMHIQTTTSSAVDAQLYLNLSRQINKEMQLIRQVLTRNDYQDPQAVCPSPLYTVVGPKGFWSSCYLIGGEGQLDWQAGREYCQEKGGDLVAIESDIEAKFLDQEIRKHSRLFSYWIGGTDGGKEGHWFWASTNHRINYSDWSYNSPDNKNGNENCLSLSNSNWNDLSCSTKQAVVCEASVPSASNKVKPHVFEKPLTICPLSADFSDGEVKETTTKITSPTTTIYNTHRTTTTRGTTTTRYRPRTTPSPTSGLESENSTAKSCYLFMESEMSWQTAQEFCEQNGGFLAAVDSEKENEFLLKSLKGIASSQTVWWMGGNDFEAGEGNWIWTSTKERLDAGFQDWYQREPNNGLGSFPENCLIFNKRVYSAISPHRWGDSRCGVWRPSICEVPNPFYNGSEALVFNHNVDHYISEPPCMPDKGTPECTNGTWTCYTYVRVQMTWTRAKEFCEKRGALLAGPDSREKADAIYKKAKSYASTGYYWLGATDAVSEGEWRWIRNDSSAEVFNREIAYSEVAPPTRGDARKNCLRMEVKSYRSRMHWNDAACDGWAWFVCEKNNCDKNVDTGKR